MKKYLKIAAIFSILILVYSYWLSHHAEIYRGTELYGKLKGRAFNLLCLAIIWSLINIWISLFGKKYVFKQDFPITVLCSIPFLMVLILVIISFLKVENMI